MKNTERNSQHRIFTPTALVFTFGVVFVVALVVIAFFVASGFSRTFGEGTWRTIITATRATHAAAGANNHVRDQERVIRAAPASWMRTDTWRANPSSTRRSVISRATSSIR